MKIPSKYHAVIFLLIVISIYIAQYVYLTHREQALTPPGRLHAMMQVDTYYPDLIRQSALGRWEIIDSHTTLSAPKTRGYIFFIFAGKIAALFHIDPVRMYEFLRISGAVLVMIATYILIVQFLPPTLHMLALVFTLIIDTGPLLTNLFNSPISQWAAASTYQGQLLRHFGLPHHLWGEAFGLLLISVIARTIRFPTHMGFVLLIFLSFFGTAILPSNFVVLVCCLFVPWLLYGFISKEDFRTTPPIITALIAFFIAALWVQFEFSKGPPWNALSALEKTWWSTDYIMKPFIQSFVLYYPIVALIPFLLPFTWRQMSKQLKRSLTLSAIWSTVPFALIVIAQAPWFPVANGRIASDLSNIPIGILSTISIHMLWKKIQSLRYARQIGKTIFIIYVCVSLFFSGIYFSQALRAQNKAVFNEGYSWTLYPTVDLWNGMMALKNVPQWSHVMILPRIGELITAYLPLRVYQSAPLSFMDWLERRGQSHHFYTGTMDSNELREILRTNKISYVFWGPEEKTALLTPALYPDFLEIYFQNSEVTIYKVKHI